MSDKRYTAQEMRNQADFILCNIQLSDYGRTITSDILRQAADAEDELEHLHEEQIRLVAENARLSARLEAVVKECRTDYDMRCKGCPCESIEYCKLTCGQAEEIVNKRQKDILRVARGEGGEK